MRTGGLVAALLLLTSCGGSSLLLLPDEDGGQGRVAVLDQRTGQARGEVTQGNSRSRLSRDRASTRSVDPARFRSGERDVIGRIPPRPVSFELNFASDSAALGPAEQELIEQIVSAARRPGVEIEIIGHADASGEPGYNLQLSRERAEAIAAALIQRQISADQITLIPMGEADLAVATADGVADPRNRRVEVTVR